MERKILYVNYFNDGPGENEFQMLAQLNSMLEEIYAGVLDVPFDDPVELDADIYKDFRIGLITDDTTINLNNTTNGNGGIIEVLIDGVGGYTVTLGTMFTKDLGGVAIDTTAGVDNFISWRKYGDDILYNIVQKK